MKEVRRFQRGLRNVRGLKMKVENIVYEESHSVWVVIFDLCNGIGTRVKTYPSLSEAVTAARWPLGVGSC